MKILVITFGGEERGRSSSDNCFSGHDIIFRKIDALSDNYLPELRKNAEFAKENQCDFIAVIPGNAAMAEQLLPPMLDMLPDKDLPTALITAIGSAGDDKEIRDKKRNSAMLMMQMLTGETPGGVENDIRLYPVKLLLHIPVSLYDDPFFNVKILIHAAYAGYRVIAADIPDDIVAPPARRPLPGMNYFISELLKKLLPIPHKRLCPRNFMREKFMEFLFHPVRSIKYLIKEHATPGGLAMAAAVGMFLGTLPLVGFHIAAIIYVSIKLRLNKMLSVNISHLCMPPFVPFACIETGHYMLNGEWLSTASMQTVIKELDLRILEWILGSLLIAPANALVFAGITYLIAISVRTGSD